MAKKLGYERFYWFHDQTKAKLYPNARKLAEEFEISSKTAQLDIEFFRDRLAAPLEYSYKEKGYFYCNDSFELPAFWLREEEVTALILAKQLAASIPDRRLKESLSKILTKLCGSVSSRTGLNFEEIAGKISLKNVEYYGTDEGLFEKVIAALLKRTPAEISYYSPYRNETSHRVIIPLHLLNYMGNWHLIAFCELRGSLRTFALSRIRQFEMKEGSIALPEGLPDIKDYISENFGIFYGGETFQVKLAFSPNVSGFVREQIWHKEQIMEQKEDGNLVLTLPVSDLREIKREVLKFGADVKVLGPESLAAEIRKEIERMGKVY